MIKKIVEHVYQLKVPIPYDFGQVNCYLIEGEKGFTIVDTGDYTEEAIAVWKKTLAGRIPVEKVVLTHAHTDHIGLAGWFQKHYNVPVWMSAKGNEELKRIRSFFIDQQYTGSDSAFLEKHGGQNYPDQDERFHMYKAYQFKPDFLFEEHQELKFGDSIYETIWTPGHSPDHFCFYNQKDQVLIVGDHILNSINPIVMCQEEGDNPLKGYLDSLDILREFRVKYVLPGHGEQFFDLFARIEKMLSHYKKRWKQIYQSINKDGSTAFEVSQRVYGSNLSPAREGSAFIQTITNLVYLNSLGYVRIEEDDEIIYFFQNQ